MLLTSLAVPTILICLDLAKDGTFDVTNESSCSYNTDLFRSG